MKKFILAIPVGVPSSIIIILITYLSLASNPLDINDISLFPGFDKLAHVIMYFGAACVFILAWANFKMPHHIKLNNELALTTFAILLGGLMEIAQLVMAQGRSFEVTDWFADILGALAGWATIHFWFMHIFRKYLLRTSSRKLHHHHHYHADFDENEAKRKVGEQQEMLKKQIEEKAKAACNDANPE